MYALAFMFLGMAAGFLLRTTPFPALAGRLLTPLICALLFAMGVLIGENGQVMAALPALGLKACVLAASTLAGSVLATLLLLRLFPGLFARLFSSGEEGKTPDGTPGR